MSVEALSKALGAAIGENDEEQAVSHFLDTGFPPLNKRISGKYKGGIPYGRIVEMFGPSSSGKTAIATLLMIAAQKAGGVAMFMDHENSFDVGMAKAMGLNDQFPFWIYKRPETWEKSNTTAMKAAEAIRKSKAIPDSAPIICVFDSVAAMIPQSVFEKGIDEYTMNDTTALARVTSTTLKSVNNFTSSLNATMLYLNQIRTKPGVAYGDPTTTPGGGAMEFYATTRLSLGRTKLMETEGGEKKMVGQNISIKTVKNKLTRPFQSITLPLMFHENGMAYFDFIGGMIEELIGLGLIERNGSRVTWEGKSLYKSQVVELLSKDPDGYAKLVAMFVDE